jgi:hypothetical protein
LREKPAQEVKMTDLSFLSQKQQKALLEAVDILCRIFWGPDPKSSKEIFVGTFLNPFKLLAPEVNYSPPASFSELEYINEKFSDTDSIYEHLEKVYVRLFVNSKGCLNSKLTGFFMFENMQATLCFDSQIR